MMTRPILRSLSVACMLGLSNALLLCVALGAHAADEISAAERKVFLDDHLRALGTSAVLRYRYAQTGTLDKNFDDAVVLTVRPKGRDTRSVEVSYLTGERKVTLPSLDNVKANPVILYFLEQEVRELHRRLGGSENYFRRRIRLAFADNAEIRPASAVVDGRQVAASEVVIRPFADDPMKARLGAFATKSYAFTLSDQVPGGVVQLRSRVVKEATAGDAGADDAAPLLEDVLSFEKLAK